MFSFEGMRKGRQVKKPVFFCIKQNDIWLSPLPFRKGLVEKHV